MKIRDSRDYSQMSDPQYDLRLWLQSELASRPHGTKGRLARHISVRPDAITRMANTDPAKESREIGAHELLKMREFFNQTDPLESDDPASVDVPIMGYLGAGAEVEPEWEQVPEEGIDQITIPFPLPADMIAFTVRGDSMLPAYKDGHVIVVYREQKRPLESFYGEDAAVRTTDGRRFIKTIMRGRPGTVTLSSFNAAPIEDVTLEWIGEIFGAFPRNQVRRVDRQGGIQGRLALKTG